MKTSHTLYLKNAARLNNIATESIDLVVTSPPYPMIAMWDDVFSRQDRKIATALEDSDGNAAFERMHGILNPVWQEIHRVLKNGGLACINIGDAVRTIADTFRLYQNHTRIMATLLNAGFHALPGIIWRKQTNAPNKFMGSGMLPAGAYVTLEHEHILVVRKKGKRNFAKAAEKQARRESACFWEERNQWFSDVWMDLKGTTQALFSNAERNRSGAFPFELPYRLINMFSVKDDMVLDPFAGLGTTGLAAMATGRNSIGVELSDAFAEDFSRRADHIVPFANQRICQRLTAHMDFVRKRENEKKPFKYKNSHYGFPVVTRQEQVLFFNALTGVAKTGPLTFEVTYSDDPQDGLAEYWGELFRKT